MFMQTPLMVQWVRELEGSNYTQARGQLRRGEDFCCLGVVGDLIPDASWVGNDLLIERAENHFALETDLDPATLEAVGLNDAQQNYLMKLNDKIGWTFPQIAAQIRWWFPAKFRDEPPTHPDTINRLQSFAEGERAQLLLILGPPALTGEKVAAVKVAV